uniref:Uncharacterized protein n=1 Tax=Opuntia streptacantha TaxID=393608 RepID=A0A7C9EKP8_OPUST
MVYVYRLGSTPTLHMCSHTRLASSYNFPFSRALSKAPYETMVGFSPLSTIFVNISTAAAVSEALEQAIRTEFHSLLPGFRPFASILFSKLIPHLQMPLFLAALSKILKCDIISSYAKLFGLGPLSNKSS